MYCPVLGVGRTGLAASPTAQTSRSNSNEIIIIVTVTVTMTITTPITILAVYLSLSLSLFVVCLSIFLRRIEARIQTPQADERVGVLPVAIAAVGV